MDANTKIPDSFSEAFSRLEPKIRAVPRGKLVAMNVEVPNVVTRLLGVLPKLEALRGQVEQLPAFDIERFNQLRDLTGALAHAHVVYCGAQPETDEVPELVEQVVELRALVLSDAATLVKRGLVEREIVAKLRGGARHVHIAFDLIGLVELYRARWDAIKDWTSLRRRELGHANTLAQRLVSSVGLKQQNLTPPRAIVRLRPR